MERVDDLADENDIVVNEEVTTARIERWIAQDRTVVVEHRLVEMEEQLSVSDRRLRRLTDELLLERERRASAEATVQALLSEAAALRTTLWWRLGRLPRWLRRHIR